MSHTRSRAAKRLITTGNALSGRFDPGGLVPLMLENPFNWTAVSRFASDVIASAKEEA
jgi:hypothetical protein